MVRVVQHFEFVDPSQVEARFYDDGRHRAYLRIPLLHRQSNRTLCVIGQNPSAANELVADSTIRYIEEFVYHRLPEFGHILMLNLYSRVDTKKVERDGVQDTECERIFNEEVHNHENFLLILGQLRNKGAYKFPDRARDLETLLRMKSVWKIDIGTSYAPHPGNRTILYQNFSVGIMRHDFADVLPKMQPTAQPASSA